MLIKDGIRVQKEMLFGRRQAIDTPLKVLKEMCLDQGVIQLDSKQDSATMLIFTVARGSDTLALLTPQVRPALPLIHNAWFSSA